MAVEFAAVLAELGWWVRYFEYRMSKWVLGDRAHLLEYSELRGWFAEGIGLVRSSGCNQKGVLCAHVVRWLQATQKPGGINACFPTGVPLRLNAICFYSEIGALCL